MGGKLSQFYYVYREEMKMKMRKICNIYNKNEKQKHQIVVVFIIFKDFQRSQSFQIEDQTTASSDLRQLLQPTTKTLRFLIKAKFLSD